MTRAILVDDEPLARKTLLNLILAHCQEVEVVGEAEDIPSAIKIIHREKPDLVFLDIEMPGYSGLQLLDFFDHENIDFEIIFVTAYSEFALRAFELSAADYLLKPIQIKRLVEAVAKVTEKQNEQSKEKLKTLKLNFSETEDDQKIALPISTGLLFVPIKDLILLRADGSYTEIYIKDETKLLVSKKLIEFEKLLSAHRKFFRPHRSFLINIGRVKQFIRGDGGYLIMENNTEVPISRDKKIELTDLLAEMRP